MVNLRPENPFWASSLPCNRGTTKILSPIISGISSWPYGSRPLADPVERTRWEGPPVILSEGEAALEFWAIIGSPIAPECLGDSFYKTSAQIGATIYHQPQQGTSTGALRPGMEVWLYKARGGFVYIQELHGTGWLKAFHVQGLSMPWYAPQLPWYGSGMYRPDRYGSDVNFFLHKNGRA